MEYKADCQISMPKETNITAQTDMSGFGWHPNHGLFVPIISNEDQIEPPYSSGSTPTRIRKF